MGTGSVPAGHQTKQTIYPAKKMVNNSEHPSSRYPSSGHVDPDLPILQMLEPVLERVHGNLPRCVSIDVRIDAVFDPVSVCLN